MIKHLVYSVLSSVLFAVLLVSCSSGVSTNDSVQLTNIALDLSATYLKNGEVDDALRVLNDATELSGDIRLIENRVLIFLNENRNQEAYDEAMRLYNTYPYYLKAIRYAIDAATKLEDNDKLKELYTLLFTRNAITIKDLNLLLKLTIEENRKDEALGIINYGIERGIYDKEFFEQAYEFTKDDEYNMALTYIK